MFSQHKAGITTIRQLKIIKEVKKLVDEMKNLYKCNFNRTAEKQTNSLKTSRKVLSLFIAFLPVKIAAAAARDQATTLYSLPSPPLFHLGKAPSYSTQDPQSNIDSSTVVLCRPSVFFLSALVSKACLGCFS